MRRRSANRQPGPGFLAGWLALLSVLPACGREGAASQPADVDLDGLAARCRPGGGDSGFRDLLRLRDEPTAAAIPALTQVLRDHVGSSRIHRYAAAQALSTIDAEDARRILEAEVARADFDGRRAFDYAFHWTMAPDARDRFLLRSVLRDAGEAPSLTLRSVPDDPARAHHLVFEVDVANPTESAQEIMDPADRGGELLVFRAVGGHVARTDWPATCEHFGARTITLEPGESRTVRIDVKLAAPAADREPGDDAQGRIVGRVDGYRYRLGGPGEYEVFARWTSPRGRSVSAPVHVVVPDPR